VESHFVRAEFDLDCDWEGLPPVYRIFVNGELFAEREWVWTDRTLREILQIQAPAGQYKIEIKKAGPCLAKFRTSNYSVEFGPAAWLSHKLLQISDASS
jgi:hypothetical protein